MNREEEKRGIPLGMNKACLQRVGQSALPRRRCILRHGCLGRAVRPQENAVHST